MGPLDINAEELKEKLEANGENNEKAKVAETQVPSTTAPPNIKATQPTDGLTELVQNTAATFNDLIDNTFQGDQKSKGEFLDQRLQFEEDAEQSFADRQQYVESATLQSDPATAIGRESTRAVLGAIEGIPKSFGALADVSGDQLKKTYNSVLGYPIDPTQDPQSPDYEKGNWWFGNEDLIAENHNPVFNFARELGTFIGISRRLGPVTGPAKAKILTQANRIPYVQSANTYLSGNKITNFFLRNFKRGTDIATDGAIADFILRSSEGENIINAANEYVPWMVPDIIEGLAYDPNTDDWLSARLKSVGAGSLTANVFAGVFTVLGKFAKHTKKLAKELPKYAKATDEKLDAFLKQADEGLEKDIKETLENNAVKEEVANNDLAQTRFEEGLGTDPMPAKQRYTIKHLDLGEDIDEYNRLIEGKQPTKYYKDSLEKRNKLKFRFKTDLKKQFEAFWKEKENVTVSDDMVINQPLKPEEMTTLPLFNKPLSNGSEVRWSIAANKLVWPPTEGGMVRIDWGIVKGPLAGGSDELKQQLTEILSNIPEGTIIRISAIADDVAGISKFNRRKGGSFRTDLFKEIGFEPKGEASELIGVRAKREGLVVTASNLDEALEFQKVILSRETNLSVRKAAIEDFEELARNMGARKGDKWDDVKGTSKGLLEENSGRKPDPVVNPDQFDEFEKGSYQAETTPTGKAPGATAVKRDLADLQNGKTGADTNNTPRVIGENYTRMAAKGDRDLFQLFEEIVEDITDEVLSKNSTLNWKQVNLAAMSIAEPFLRNIEAWGKDGKLDLVKMHKETLDDFGDVRGKKPPKKTPFKNSIFADGEWQTTIGPLQKNANMIVLRSLGRLLSDITSNTIRLNNGLHIYRQWDQITDLMKVLFVENKLAGMAWGQDGQAMQAGWGFFRKEVRLNKAEQVQAIKDNAREFFDNNLKNLTNEGRLDEAAELMELFALTDGLVRSQNDIIEFLRTRVWGGRMPDMNGKMRVIKGELRNQLLSTYYNSILGRIKTSVKAVTMTNMLAFIRPFESLVGNLLPHRLVLNQLEGTVSKNLPSTNFANPVLQKPYNEGGADFTARQIGYSLAMIESMTRSWVESWKMAWRNYKLAIQNKPLDYTTKVDVAKDIKEFKNLKKYYFANANRTTWISYNVLENLLNFNAHPVVKNTTNVMQGGDTFARTIIARQNLAATAWGKALDEGVPLKDIPAWVKKHEDEFQDEIFKATKEEGIRVVSDKGTMMAGDEAALTTALTGHAKMFQNAVGNPFFERWFPFLRPGFNAVDVSLKRIPVVHYFREEYRDLVVHGRNLDKWGVTPQTLPNRVAEIEGRMAIGTGMVGLAIVAAMNGRLIGDVPPDEAERKLWKLNRIQPNSFAWPKPVLPGQPEGSNGYVYVSFRGIEVFSTIFNMVANAVQFSGTLGGRKYDEVIKDSIWMTSAALVDNSLIGNFETLVDVFGENSTSPRVQRFIANGIRTQFPFAGKSADIAGLFTPYDVEANNLIELIGKRDAIAKGALPPRYDIFNKGRTAKQFINGAHSPILRLVNTFSPVAITTTDGDDVKEALLAVRYNLPELLSSYKGVKLTSKEISDLEKELATDKTLRKDLLKVINKPDFKEKLKLYQSGDYKLKDGWNYKDWTFYSDINVVMQSHRNKAIRFLIHPSNKLHGNINDPSSLRSRVLTQQQKTDVPKTRSTSRIEATKKLLDMKNK